MSKSVPLFISLSIALMSRASTVQDIEILSVDVSNVLNPNFTICSSVLYDMWRSYYTDSVMDFWQRSLYRARIAFLWGATAISKNEV